VRIAAIADLHITARTGDRSCIRRLDTGLSRLSRSVDVLVLAGDLTDHGRRDEAQVLADRLRRLPMAVVAVLGNHDYEAGEPDVVRQTLASAGVHVLDGESCVIDDVGFAGAKGFGGGFAPHALGAWGEPQIKAFALEGEREALALETALSELDTPQRIAVLHYAPIRGTITGEPLEIYPYLGSVLLEHALARGRATLVFHGHAHAGKCEGATSAGVPVLNVAAPLLAGDASGRISPMELEIDPVASGPQVAAARRIRRAVSASRRTFYRDCLRDLEAAGVPHLIGGGIATERYTRIRRATHDVDVLIRRIDLDAAMCALAREGRSVELTALHWLAKARGQNGAMLDVIFSSGNGVCTVDNTWFTHAVPDTVLGRRVLLCPVEELIWMKSFVMERERYDGADIAHLLLTHAKRIDWSHMLWRFGPHWRVLLSHLVLFGFVYPRERGRIPGNVVRELTDRMCRQAEIDDVPVRPDVCRGGLLSRAQYLADFQRGYLDARRRPIGALSDEDIEAWTSAIETEHDANGRPVHDTVAKS
jgi:Icc-related predicted phosphoesterase